MALKNSVLRATALAADDEIQVFIENVVDRPKSVALFYYVFTNCLETAKKLRRLAVLTNFSGLLIAI